MYERQRNIVVRPDGKRVNVARPRGQLFVCASGCCCGLTELGFPPVPTDLYHYEWERRRLRNVVHLTMGGCLGPCGLANVALVLFDGQAQWFQAINSDRLVIALYDHIETMLDADQALDPPAELATLQFTASAWQARPDGQPVDDYRPRKAQKAFVPKVCEPAMPDYLIDSGVERLVADMHGSAAMPRKNGELVFNEPWEGRAFGMAIALHEQGRFEWEEFRQRLIANIAEVERSGTPFHYYTIWLETLEQLLLGKALVDTEEINEAAYQFEFGERDDVF